MNKRGENIFVFVVCGAKEYIDTLHFSLQALKKYSVNSILIITDSLRNEVSVVHSDIIDVRTPANLDNHQASIFLKTSLHRYLPKGNSYCYLDTDVVALSSAVDDIFELYEPPIMFATDHCVLNEFSPAAVNCICRAKFDADNTLLRNELTYFDKHILPQLDYIDKCLIEIESQVTISKSNMFTYWWHWLRYMLPLTHYKLNNKFKLDKRNGRWYDNMGKLLWYEHRDNIRYAEERTGFEFNSHIGEWFDNAGNSLAVLGCNHLIEAIEQKFGIKINAHNWRHWNGGVFLFNDLSESFLDTWHELTMQALEDSYWKTRDQGTLAATVWKLGLQNQVVLPVAYNFIADYNRLSMLYKGGLSFSIGSIPVPVKPVFIHIYHHWGDSSWPVWCDVKQYIETDHAENK